MSLAELGEHPIVAWAPPGESMFTDFLLGLFPDDARPQHRVSRAQGLPPEHALEHQGEFVLTTGGMPSSPSLVSLPVLPVVTISTYALWRDRADLMAVLSGANGGA